MESGRFGPDGYGMNTENTGLILCRLLAAWIHHTALDAAERPDYEALLQTANKHLLTAAACAALEQTGLMAVCPPEVAERFREARAKSIRKTLLMDAERGKILAAMEARGIWYAPLKGATINAVYPQYGTRQFADNDILFDAERWRDVRDFMKGRGYKTESVSIGAHDAYLKPPIYNFELHRRLFAEGECPFSTAAAAYYGDVKERLIKDEGNQYGYHFVDEDFYVYFLAHACKHYSWSGTGLRTLLDLYLYRRAKPDLDTAYIAAEVQKLGLADFEATCFRLTEKIFSPSANSALTERERDMLRLVENAGVYGSIAQRVQSGLRRYQGDDLPVTAWTKVKYLFRQLFPEWEWYRGNAPFVYRHRWAVPFFWVYRLCRGVFVHGRQNFREASAVYTYRDE